jgi:phage gp29-like protein
MQVSFQLYTKARDSDAGLLLNNDDDLDDIFIDLTLDVDSGFTELEVYTGELNRVTVQMRFRVMCQRDYYGADCSTLCVAQNDDMNGYYTCNSDGSLQCLEGFTNPQNNCTDSKL